MNLPALPGTKHIRPSYLNSGGVFCEIHKTQIIPVLIGEGITGGGQRTYPACEECINEEAKDYTPAEVKDRSWRDVGEDEWEWVCLTDGCYNMAKDSMCHVCQQPKCEKCMYQQGTFGLCVKCKESGHVPFE